MTTALHEHILKGALLGLERGAPVLPATEGALGAEVARIPPGDSTAQWLDAAALSTIHAQAGWLPGKGRHEAAVCADETRVACGPAVRQFLETMLSGRCDVVLPEWIVALDRAGLRAPETAVPALLFAALKHKEEAEAFKSCCGEVGRWIGLQNSNWHKLYATESPEVWTDGTLPERTAWLEGARTRDAAGARDALAAVWDKEGPKERAALLSALKAGLSQADEPFLESALDDRRKEVRRAAADLLALLPQSRFVARMHARLQQHVRVEKPLLRIDKRGRVECILPASHDAAMERDGIDNAPAVEGIGQKAWWVTQMIARTAPSYWCKGGLTPEKLLKAQEKSEWELPVRWGWNLAAIAHRDEAWCLALLLHPSALVGPMFTHVLLGAVSSLALQGLLPEIAPAQNLGVFAWAELVRGQWTAPFSIEAARRLHTELKNWQTARFHVEHLPHIAARMHLGAAEQIAKSLDPASLGEAAPAALEMLEILRFRRDALAAIKETNRERTA